jgi:Zn-dependent protease with chaperone function
VTTLSLVVVVVALLVPTLTALVWGRRLAASQGEPGLPERWHAYSNALRKLGGAAGAAVIIAADALALPLVLLLPVLMAAGTFPSRRRILGESWRLGAFLAYVVRFHLALSIFWILLLVAPTTIAALDSWQRSAAALAFGLVLGVWTLGFGTFVRKLTGAREVEGPAIAARFQELVSRSQVLAGGPRPALLHAGPRGGAWTLNVGVPLQRRPFVLVADVLLEKLTLDELAALLGHHLALLEHRRRRRPWGRVVRNWLLILGSITSVPLFAGLAPEFLPALPCLWFLLISVAATLEEATNEQLVPQLDRRAIELSGDPEALVRALIKVQTLSKLPGRWDGEFDKITSQPSLASRIRAIRELAGFQPLALDEEVVLESNEAGRYAILGPEQVWFLDGVTTGERDAAALRQRAASSRAYAYRTLSAIHLRVHVGGGLILCAVPSEGKETRLPLARDSVERAQKALEGLDGKMAPKVAGRTPLVVMAMMGAVLLNLACCTPMTSGLLFIPVFLVFIRREVAPVMGAASVAIVVGLLALVHPVEADERAVALAVAGMALLAGGLLAFVARRLARVTSANLWKGYRETVVLFGTLAAAGTALAATQAIRVGWELDATQTAGPVLALGLAVVIWARYRANRWARAVALVWVLGALAPAVLGSDLARPGWNRRHFPATAWEAEWQPAPPPARTLTVPSDLYDFHLSPAGRRFVARSVRARDGDPTPFVVGDETGQTRPLHAQALAFIDEARLLVFRKDRREFVVEEIGANFAATGWQARVPARWFFRAKLVTDGKRFRLIGREPTGWIAFDGEIGSSVLHTRHAGQADRDGGAQVDWIRSGESDAALSVRVDYRSLWPRLLDDAYRTSLELELAGGSPIRLLNASARVSCPEVPLSARDFLCVASVGARSWIWVIDAPAGQVHALLRLPGQAIQTLRSGDTLAMQLAEGGVAFFDPRAVRFVRLQDPDAHLAAFSERAYAALRASPRSHSATLTIYDR